jgi:glycosyltransferase involved in cell wall biosynthesis
MLLERDYPPDLRVEKEIKSLSEAGHKITLACFTHRKKMEIENTKNCVIYRFPISKFTFKSSVAALKFPFYFNFWRDNLDNLFQKDLVDVIHVHDLPLAKVGIELKHEYNIPLVLDLHENWPALLQVAAHTNTFLGKLLSSNKQWIKYEKKSIQQADKVIVVVEEMKARISKTGFNKSNIVVLQNTVDYNSIKIEPQVKKDSKFRLFYAGGINVHRGLQVVLRAIKIVKKEIPQILFEIAGSGKYESFLWDFVLKHEISENVNFHGWLPYTEMIRLLQKSDVAVIPHLRSIQTDNSSPNKLFQYAYLKKPILASNCISVSRILNEMNAGLIYVQEDAFELAAKLIKLCKDLDLRKQLGNAGHQAVVSKYNWQQSVAEFLEMYKKLDGSI